MEYSSRRIIASMIITLSLIGSVSSINMGINHSLKLKECQQELDVKQSKLYLQIRDDSTFRSECSKNGNLINVDLTSENITSIEYDQKVRELCENNTIIQNIIESNATLESKYLNQIKEIKALETEQSREQTLGLASLGCFAISTTLLGVSINDFPKKTEDEAENIL